MGNITDKLNQMGESISQAFTDIHKSFKALVYQPEKPLPMPDLGVDKFPDQLRTKAELMYDMDTKQFINIGFLGSSTKSKIDLINALRYTTDCKGDQGLIDKNNMAVQYVHCDPAYKHLRFWDVKEKNGTFESRCLYGFDALVLLTENLQSNDLDLIKQANTILPNVPILLVRSNMNLLVDQESGLHPEKDDVAELKNREGPVIKKEIENQLLSRGIDYEDQRKCIFLISPPGVLAARTVNFDGTKYLWDEVDFMKKMLDIIAKSRY